MSVSSTLQRWVATHPDQLRYTDDGLLDIDRMSDGWYTGESPVDADDLRDAEYSYALLAPGGLGKSNLVDVLTAADPAAAVVDLRLPHPRGIAGAIDEAASDGRAVYIDALDEVLATNPQVATNSAAFSLPRLRSRRAGVCCAGRQHGTATSHST